MNFEEAIKKMLFDRGLFEDQCNEIFTRMEASPANEAMKGRWQEKTDDYPEIMLDIAWIFARKEALDFIDETCPNAWFRPLFVNASATTKDPETESEE